MHSEPIIVTGKSGRSVSIPIKSVEARERMRNVQASGITLRTAHNHHTTSAEIIARKKREERINARDLMRNDSPSNLRNAFC